MADEEEFGDFGDFSSFEDGSSLKNLGESNAQKADFNTVAVCDQESGMGEVTCNVGNNIQYETRSEASSNPKRALTTGVPDDDDIEGLGRIGNASIIVV